MRYRGHGRAPIWEMTASMFVSSFLAIAVYLGGVTVDADALLATQHVGMFPSMLAVMLLRLDKYAAPAH